MPVVQNVADAVDRLFQRLHLLGQGGVTVAKTALGQLNDLANRIVQHAELL
ncbi:hypothetical protein SDC9_174846 [bioreactor metagenome]|uniref:Uncharacterized protein n=1 Tax=bioreactor metagenome TaxID=1076179 RepID=A0A645GUU4_9ZZZZ